MEKKFIFNLSLDMRHTCGVVFIYRIPMTTSYKNFKEKLKRFW